MSTNETPQSNPGAQNPGPQNFGFGEFEVELRDLARRFLAEQLPTTRLRELVAADHQAVYDRGEAAGWDRDMWAQIVDMGWTALAVPEHAGGTPVSMAGLAGLVEEAGFSALPSPLVSTIAATLLLRSCDADAARPWLQAIAEGASATLATTDPSGSWRATDCAVEATGDGDGLRLTGSAAFVQDAAKAQLFVVLCRSGDDHALAVVDRDATGVSIEADHIHDLTRDQATVRFDGVAVGADAVVSTDGVHALDTAWPAILTITAADLCGTAEWLLQTTVDYAKDRVQFDRPIGFFQAVKHPLVDVMIDLDRARSLVYHASAIFDDGAPDAQTASEEAARMAKSAASDAAGFAADRAVQLHGGIGFTWEHDAHIYFKRAMHNQALYGDGRYQRRLLADLMLGPVVGA